MQRYFLLRSRAAAAIFGAAPSPSGRPSLRNQESMRGRRSALHRSISDCRQAEARSASLTAWKLGLGHQAIDGRSAEASESNDRRHAQEWALEWPRPARSKSWARPSERTRGLADAYQLTPAYLGSPTWARTRDLRINSPALYRLSYRGTALNYRQLFRGFCRLRGRLAATRGTCAARAGTGMRG